MFGNEFYHSTTRKYVAAFGTLFNDIYITRTNGDSTTQRFRIPVNYGPMQKFLAKTQQDPNFTAPAITLPRMTFELTAMTYDGTRKLGSLIRNRAAITDTNSDFKAQFSAVPYNMDFTLSIMTKFTEDGTKILEQIIPFFTPDFTPTIELISSPQIRLDVPIVLTSVSQEDVYEGSYEERRAIIWTLTFSMKGYYFGPVTNKKVIKFSEANTYSNIDPTTAVSDYTIAVQPGLTANGEPTTVLTDSVAYANINYEDDWAYIVDITDATVSDDG